MTLWIVATLMAMVMAQDCFKHGTNCYACKGDTNCGWCQVGTGNDISEGCQPKDREQDCRMAANNMKLTYVWNGQCPLLTGADPTPTPPFAGGSQTRSQSPFAGSDGNSDGTSSQVSGSNSSPNSNTGIPSTTTAAAHGNGAPVVGVTAKCNPECEKCDDASGNNGGASKKRACAATWSQYKSKLIGNNCGYEIGSSRTANWKDDSCVVIEKACIPPQGSSERPIYETCANPTTCEKQSPGWKCGECALVEDDGTGQKTPGTGCPASALSLASVASLMQALVVVAAL